MSAEFKKKEIETQKKLTDRFLKEKNEIKKAHEAEKTKIQKEHDADKTNIKNAYDTEKI